MIPFDIDIEIRTFTTCNWLLEFFCLERELITGGDLDYEVLIEQVPKHGSFMENMGCI